MEEIKDAFRNQNIDENKIISNLSTEEIVKEMKNDNRQAFFLVNYTKMADLRSALGLN